MRLRTCVCLAFARDVSHRICVCGNCVCNRCVSAFAFGGALSWLHTPPSRWCSEGRPPVCLEHGAGLLFFTGGRKLAEAWRKLWRKPAANLGRRKLSQASRKLRASRATGEICQWIGHEFTQIENSHGRKLAQAWRKLGASKPSMAWRVNKEFWQSAIKTAARHIKTQ